ncbi:MAG: UDP-glucose dehydrogenase family protein [Gemmatimonadota bacterium]
MGGSIDPPMSVGVIGTGHVGLITCLSMAEVGHRVVGIDAVTAKIEALLEGRMPFHEPGGQDLLDQQLASGRLKFTSETADAVSSADVVFICVGTPARASGEANLVAVERAARDIARAATGPLLIVEKSTVPAGTSAQLERMVAHERPDLTGTLDVASNPEFLREGRALHDARHPDRILVGARSPKAFETMRRLYRPFLDEGVPLIETDIASAELAKHASNAFLALKISYVNALARICEVSGADIEAVARVMGADPRIGPEFLRAGLGFGGYCFPKDLSAFERVSEGLGYRFPMLAEVGRINDEAIDAAVSKIRDVVWNLDGKRVALLGLAFKPDTDDVRFSPALTLARRLVAEGAVVVGFDPVAGAAAREEIPELELAPDPYGAAEGASCVVVCTAWEEFRGLDLGKLGERMAARNLVDGRNLFDAAAAAAAGVTYRAMGRPDP